MPSCVLGTKDSKNKHLLQVDIFFSISTVQEPPVGRAGYLLKLAGKNQLLFQYFFYCLSKKVITS